MNEIKMLDTFQEWMHNQKDNRLVAKVVARINQIRGGNFGDHKSVSDGVSELRIHYGPGYRIYYTVRGRIIVILLCAGDKSTQSKDIQKAKLLNKEVA
jgi:putative addiction module killer protein